MIKVDIDSNVHGPWNWAMETFGVPPTRWIYGGYNVFYFREEADASLFLLRWA